MNIVRPFRYLFQASVLIAGIMGNAYSNMRTTSEVLVPYNPMYLFGSPYPSEEIRVDFDSIRTGKGSPFLVDFFTPYLLFQAALYALNREIQAFNANYPPTLVHRKGDDADVRQSVFQCIQKDESIPFFKIIKIMNEYTSPTYPHGDTQILVDIYKEVRSKEDLDAGSLITALEDIANQVGYGWHLKDGAYHEGIGQTEDGEIIYAPNCTITAEKEVPLVTRAYFLTEDIRRIANIATILRKQLSPLLSSEKNVLYNLFVPIQDDDPKRLWMFDYNGTTYKLRDDLSLNIVSSLNNQNGSLSQQVEQFATVLGNIYTKILRIYSYAH